MLDPSSSAFRVLKGARIFNAQLSLLMKGNRKGTTAAGSVCFLSTNPKTLKAVGCEM